MQHSFLSFCWAVDLRISLARDKIRDASLPTLAIYILHHIAENLLPKI